MTSPALTLTKRLQSAYPWTKTPLIISAPMKVMAGPALCTQVSAHGGIGFLGPGAKPEDTFKDLQEVQKLISEIPSLSPSHNNTNTNTKTSSSSNEEKRPLPIGIAFQTWTDSLEIATQAVTDFSPFAAWLFAPRNGQIELDDWSRTLRSASSRSETFQIWIQVGTLTEALAAAESSEKPDVLVIQGSDAGGHGRAKDGSSLLVLLPEVADALARKGIQIPLIAAGGIIDARGAVAALALGASGVAMGTRFLACNEARIAKGYQDEVLRAENGAETTVRTQLYNHLRGTFGWPEEFSPRTVVNASWREHLEGRTFEELKEDHDEMVKKGDVAWGPEGRTATYAGVGVGLVRDVKGAGEIVVGIREDVKSILKELGVVLSD